MGRVFMTAAIGIDPGLSGAIARVADDGARYEVHDMPIIKLGSKKQYDIHRLFEMLVDFGEGLPCYCEKVGAMPKQGLASTFTFGMGYGIAQALAIAAGHRLSFVRPQTWKARMLRDASKTKHAACGVARNLFPEAELTGKRGGLKDGRCEALLIAELARRENYAG